MKKKSSLKHTGAFWAFCAPCCILFGVFFLVPLVLSIAFSFTNYDGWKTIDFVGLTNYITLFKDSKFYLSLGRTLLYTVCTLPFRVIIPLLVAVLLCSKRVAAKSLTRTMVYIPVLMSALVVGITINWMFSQEYGLINFIIQSFGGDPVDVYMNSKYWPFILTVVNIWKGIGMGSMMYFAALMGIDTSLYEAAEIDGAGRFQKMLHISLPHLVPLICIFTIMNAGTLISGNFDLFYVIPRNTSTLYATTDILNTYVYRSLQESSYAIGATTGLIQSVVGMFLVLLSNWIVKKISPDNSMF